MATTRLTVSQVTWCARGGHPVLVLNDPARNHSFGMGVTVEDAQVMAASIQGIPSGRTRLFDLIDTLLAWLEGSIVGVTLRPDDSRVLQAELLVDGPGGRLCLPVQVVDGVLLAWRAGKPIEMEEGDLARTLNLADGSGDPGPTPDRAGEQHDVFRSFIETLDLD